MGIHAPEFLFHTGSIKSHTPSTGFNASSEFLFHTGSIKRSPTQSTCMLDGGFYSILVRLKGIGFDLRQRLVVNSFYSILVRLKVLMSVEYVAVPMFLFHTGSIKSSFSVSPICTRTFPCFYSILVRLKGNRMVDACGFSVVSIPYWFD